MYRSALLALLLTVIAGPAMAAPAVLATIKPVHSLVASVMAGAGTPELLITGALSEHSFALKPSDARKIERSRVIFEIGPDLETYLIAPLRVLAPGADVVMLESAPGMRLLRARRGGLWQDDAVPPEGPTDPHLWLDPENAIAATRAIAAALSGADRGHAALYTANAARTIEALRVLERGLRARLAPLTGRHYLVFHDAYHYFETRFGLTPAGAVTVAPDRPIGPRRVETLRAAIAAGGVACVFREPQFSPRMVDTLVEGSSVRVGVLDPLGADLTPGADLYAKLLEDLAGSLGACLNAR
jgi:zinc transport system substrate-binding protein